MKRFKINSVKFLSCILMIALFASSCLADGFTIPESAADQYRELNKRYIQFSSELYHLLLNKNRLTNISNINTLNYKAASLYNKGNITESVALVINNLSTINKNINTKQIIGIEKILLDANEFRSALEILETSKRDSDPALVSNILFKFAEYYTANYEWDKVVNLIEKIANDLPQQEYQHALFMEGFALQKLHKHRRAMEIYNKIPETSQYYVNAQLNTAISDFRQEWWTDAHNILDKLLKNSVIDSNNELSDRLHATIGYSFLQLEYFRNSRDAFRNVSLSSSYTNQALIGIALDAAYQKDYVGALNAVRVLKNKNESDLESEESHLLLPYFYEKLHQHATASAGYTSAIKYYETRLQSIKTASMANTSFYKDIILSNNADKFTLNGEHILLASTLPPAFFRQIYLLNEYRNIVEKINNKQLSRTYLMLNDQFANSIKNISLWILKQKSSYITDYMNQCRYGLARLYDKTTNNN